MENLEMLNAEAIMEQFTRAADSLGLELDSLTDVHIGYIMNEASLPCDAEFYNIIYDNLNK